MFRTFPLSSIKSFSLYTQQWFMLYRFADSLWAGSGRTMAQGLTQPLTEMSTMNISWGGGAKCGRCVGLTTLPPSCPDSFEIWEPQPPVMGLLYLSTKETLLRCYISSSSVICQTTGPKPLPKQFLHIVRSRASSFNWQYPLLSLRLSSSFLRLLPRLLVTSICPFIFPSITCGRRQFLRKMCPIQLAFRFLISCRIFLCSLTLSNTSSFLTWSVQRCYIYYQENFWNGRNCVQF